MKKIISVLLAAVMLFGMCAVIALADEGEGYVPVYTVRVDSATEGKVAIVNVEDPNSNTVNKGRSFFFTLQYQKGYSPDGTVVVKAYPASYLPDLVVTYEDSTEMITLEPDANGVYCIPNVQEDYYVRVFNVTETQFSSLKDMLINFFNAIITFFKNIFHR